jgi:hypothetical protein
MPEMPEIPDASPRSEPAAVGLTRASVIDLIGLIVIVGFAVAVFHCYVKGAYDGRGYPYNTFLFQPDDHFNDFNNALRCVDPSFGGPAWDPEMRNPIWKLGWPFINLVHYPFVPLGLRWGAVVSQALFITGFLAWVSRYLKGSGAVVTVRNVMVFSFLTYPFLFALDRTNLEIFVWLFLAIFFACHGTPRHRIGLVALAAAVAMKALPGVYLVLLWCDRRWKDSLVVGMLAIGLNLAAATVLPGGFSHNIDRWLFQTTDFYQKEMVVGNGGLMFGNSLWGAGKIVLGGMRSLVNPAVANLQLPYLIACFAAFALVVLYVVRYESVWWKRVALLSFSMILLPFVSADYRLLHVFFPLFMFIDSGDRGRYAKFYAVLFALLLIPKGYVHLRPDRQVTIQVILNPLIMIAMSTAIIWEGLRSPANPHQAREVEP